MAQSWFKSITDLFELSGSRSDTQIANEALPLQKEVARREIASMIAYSSQVALKSDGDKATDGIRSANPLSAILKPEHDDLSNLSLGELVALREELAKTVAPATPAGTWIAYRANFSRFRYLGAVSVMRWLLFLGIVCLIGASFVVSLEPDVLEQTIGAQSSDEQSTGTGTNPSHEEADNLSGWTIAFAIFMAGIGGAFRGLYQGYLYITRRQYDTTYNTTYLKRFFLGLMSGLILVLALRGVTIDLGFEVALAVILPLVGGFSVDLADILLRRIEQALKALIGESSSNRQ